jgi:hypothetical protein
VPPGLESHVVPATLFGLHSPRTEPCAAKRPEQQNAEPPRAGFRFSNALKRSHA